jgi:MinD superfamily P-loop ATPase
VKSKINKIIVLSGKGGTGKTTVASAFNKLAQNNITVDCDVDAADLFILLDPEIRETTNFIGGKKAKINYDACNYCGLCENLCRFDAIKNFYIDTVSCEGCGLCFRACPANAITFESVTVGEIYISELRDKNKFYFAELFPGESNSGKLVSKLKEKQENYIKANKTDWVIIDGPPGIGCPVNASLAGVDIAVLVTEPTYSGLHDLERLIKLLQTFKIRSTVIINKYDLNLSISKKIEDFINKNKISLLGHLSYNYAAVRALQNKKTIVEYSPTLSGEINNIWKNLINLLNGEINENCN